MSTVCGISKIDANSDITCSKIRRRMQHSVPNLHCTSQHWIAADFTPRSSSPSLSASSRSVALFPETCRRVAAFRAKIQYS